MEQIIDIFYTLIPVFVILLWVTVLGAIVWGLVQLIRKRSTKQF